jgi:hypothetical protein
VGVVGGGRTKNTACVLINAGWLAQDAEVAAQKQLSERRRRAEERRQRLLGAAERNDTDVLEDIYDSLHDDIRSKARKLRTLQEQLDAARRDATDQQGEFEREREQLLDDLRRSDRALKFHAAVLEQVLPLLRRDCNYFSLDRVRAQAQWDDDAEEWLLPAVSGGGMAAVSGGGMAAATGPAAAAAVGNGAAAMSAAERAADHARLLGVLNGGTGEDGEGGVGAPPATPRPPPGSAVRARMQAREAEVASRTAERLARYDAPPPSPFFSPEAVLLRQAPKPPGTSATPARRRVAAPAQPPAGNTNNGYRYTASDWLA